MRVPDLSCPQVHADLYDNVYVVVKGTKIFTLLPPQVMMMVWV